MAQMKPATFVKAVLVVQDRTVSALNLCPVTNVIGNVPDLQFDISYLT